MSIDRPHVHVPPAQTLAAYDRWAARYDTDDNPLVAATAYVLATEPLAVAGRRVVELGCGTGRHAPPMLDAGAAAFTGIDGSAAMLDVARRRTGDPRVRWIEAPLDALPAPDAPYDVGLVVLVLEHIATLRPVLDGAARWLAPGATLRVLELHPERIAAGTAAHFVDGDTEHHFTSVAHAPAALVAALDDAGFDATAWTWPADDALVAAVPRLRKHAGRPVVLDVTATRR